MKQLCASLNRLRPMAPLVLGVMTRPVAGLLALMVIGPGPYSLDSKLGLEPTEAEVAADRVAVAARSSESPAQQCGCAGVPRSSVDVETRWWVA